MSNDEAVLEETLQKIRARLGEVPIRRGMSSCHIELHGSWWLFVPSGTYVVGERIEERTWVDAHHPDLIRELRWVPRRDVLVTDDLLVRETPLLAAEAPSIDLDRERLFEDLDDAETDALYAHEDEIERILSDLEQQSRGLGLRVLGSDEWEIAIRLLGAEAPYFSRGEPPTGRAMREMRGSPWGMPHFCRDGDLWIRRGGPLLAWPFQDPREWALTIPSLRHGPFDPDTCLLRPCLPVSSLAR